MSFSPKVRVTMTMQIGGSVNSARTMCVEWEVGSGDGVGGLDRLLSLELLEVGMAARETRTEWQQQPGRAGQVLRKPFQGRQPKKG